MKVRLTKKLVCGQDNIKFSRILELKTGSVPIVGAKIPVKLINEAYSIVSNITTDISTDPDEPNVELELHSLNKGDASAYTKTLLISQAKRNGWQQMGVIDISPGGYL